MTAPRLHLQTVFVLNDDGRIVSTREPRGAHGPLFPLQHRLDHHASLGIARKLRLTAYASSWKLSDSSSSVVTNATALELRTNIESHER